MAAEILNGKLLSEKLLGDLKQRIEQRLAEGRRAPCLAVILVGDSPAAFAAAVVTLLRDPARRALMAAAARQFVVRNFDWSVVAEHLERALLDTTVLHPPPIATLRRATDEPIGAS